MKAREFVADAAEITFLVVAGAVWGGDAIRSEPLSFMIRGFFPFGATILLALGIRNRAEPRIARMLLFGGAGAYAIAALLYATLIMALTVDGPPNPSVPPGTWLFSALGIVSLAAGLRLGRAK